MTKENVLLRNQIVFAYCAPTGPIFRASGRLSVLRV